MTQVTQLLRNIHRSNTDKLKNCLTCVSCWWRESKIHIFLLNVNMSENTEVNKIEICSLLSVVFLLLLIYSFDLKCFQLRKTYCWLNTICIRVKIPLWTWKLCKLIIKKIVCRNKLKMSICLTKYNAANNIIY